MSPTRAQLPSASQAALEQCVNKGQRQGLAPQSQAGLGLLTGPHAVIHRRGNPLALLSVPTLAPVPTLTPALIPIPIAIPVSALPGSSTGPMARWTSHNLVPVPRAMCSLAELCSPHWSQDLD